MTVLNQDINFDAGGKALWARVTNMTGLVKMDYTWDLLSTNAADPHYCTKASRTGDNLGADRCYPIINDFFTPPPPQEPLGKMDGRYIDLYINVKGTPGTGYAFTVEVLQGDNCSSAKSIGHLDCPASATLGAGVYMDSYECILNLHHS